MKWNISLFHYRNYGDDFGRVLVGIQRNDGYKCEGMNKFLNELGYPYIEETNNPAYEKFLRMGGDDLPKIDNSVPGKCK